MAKDKETRVGYMTVDLLCGQLETEIPELYRNKNWEQLVQKIDVYQKYKGYLEGKTW